MKKNLAVFISGHGSNLEIFLQNKEQFNSVIVVSSKAEAYGLERAKKHKASSLVLDIKIDWQLLHQSLIEKHVDLIFCAGFMKIIPENFVNLWSHKLFNLHPSMLPKYKGLKAIERAYEAQDEIGVTIHQVVPEVDAGAVILQEPVLSAGQYSKLSLAQVTELVHQTEHKLVKSWIELNS